MRQSFTTPAFAYPARPMRDERKSAVHAAALALVWLTIAVSGVVFSEPAPVDALAMALVVLLPVLGLTRITPALLTYLALWLVVAAGAYLSATVSADIQRSTVHTSVSLYLYVSSFVFAAFVAKKPDAHTRLIFNAWIVAGIITALAGLAGYFKVVPGAFELFTKFDRASGTFKDPNVFGPFLVVPFLYLLHLALNRTLLRAIIPLAVAGILALAVFLSFSRGAWVNLAAALAIYAFLAFVTAPTEAQRSRILMFVAAGSAVVVALVAVALQDDKVFRFVEERASLTQSYDVGPEGRFGGQEKAIGLILENPLGIGSQQFTPLYHPEEVHNVYLSLVLNAGWIGGGIYMILVALTVALGFRHLLKSTATRPLFLIAYSAFLSTALEGAIIDSDHWRHFYLLMAIVWGMMSADETQARRLRDVRR